MDSLVNLLIIGVRAEMRNPMNLLEEGIHYYSLNLWLSNQPDDPINIITPYRGGYIGGFNDATVLNRNLLIADGEGILAYDLAEPSKGYAEFNSVREVSDAICATPNQIVSCLHNMIQVREKNEVVEILKGAEFLNRQVDIPYRQLQYPGEGDTVLDMLPIVRDDHEAILLNNAENRSYLIPLDGNQPQEVALRTDKAFSDAFQRQQQYHFMSMQPSLYTVFTESTFRASNMPSSDDQYPNRVYSLDIRGPPIVEELEPLHFKGRQILSMLPTQNDRLTLLTKYDGRSHLEILDPFQREILNSRHLSRKYELGDRLQKVDEDLLIVRHLKNEIVDASTEDYIHLTGAENDVPIPEISSTWNVPQYLYVSKAPGSLEKEKKKK